MRISYAIRGLRQDVLTALRNLTGQQDTILLQYIDMGAWKTHPGEITNKIWTDHTSRGFQYHGLPQIPLIDKAIRKYFEYIDIQLIAGSIYLHCG